MNKFKKLLLKCKLNFIKRVAPEMVTHWNEDGKKITFYQTYSFDENIKPVVIKKPIWLRLIQLIAYGKLK